MFMLPFYVFMKLISIPFTSSQSTLISIFYKAGLVLMNSLSFCLFREIFISSLFLKDNFARYRIPRWQGCFFFLSIFEYIIPFSPSLKSFCWEIHLHGGFVLYKLSLLLLLSKSFSNFWPLNYGVSHCSPFQFQRVWGFLDMDVHFSFQVWEDFSHIALNILLLSVPFSSPPEIPIMGLLFLLILSLKSRWLSSHFSNFFFLIL